MKAKTMIVRGRVDRETLDDGTMLSSVFVSQNKWKRDALDEALWLLPTGTKVTVTIEVEND